MKNEAAYLEEKGALGVRIERPIGARRPFLFGRDEDDLTEVGLDDHTFAKVIHNDGKMSYLWLQMNEWLKSLPPTP